MQPLDPSIVVLLVFAGIAIVSIVAVGIAVARDGYGCAPERSANDRVRPGRREPRSDELGREELGRR